MAREADQAPHPEHRKRIQKSWGGTFVAVGGTAFAIIALLQGSHSHVPAVIGFVAALIGAGMIDPALVIRSWKEWRR